MRKYEKETTDINRTFFFVLSHFRVFEICLSFFITISARADWPEFRGPRGSGHADGDLPISWSETDNVRWKVEIPHRGWSTPVVLGNQVWLTTATVDGRDFYAIGVDLESGRAVYNRHLFHCDKPEPLGNAMNCYASPSPVIEPGRVYVHFGSYGTACLDTASAAVLWKRDDLPCRHLRGPGSSPILFRNLLILTMDGVDRQYSMALDTKTGRTVWKTDRTTEWNDLDDKGQPRDEGDLRKAYSTPLVIDVNGAPVMLSVGAMSAYAYDPVNGRELWKVRHGGYSGATRPVYGLGLAFLATGSGQSELLAVRPDGHGDVSETHVVRRSGRGAPRLPSPVIADDLLYTLADNGVLVCSEVASGKEIWRERFSGEFAASLLTAKNRVYAFGMDGRATVFRAGRAFERLATNVLDAGFLASPAVAGNALILRTKTHLYRIES